MIARLVRLATRPRRLTTRFTRLHAALLRASGGRIRRSFVFALGQPVLSLTTTGRRSGRPRSTVVTYFRDGESFVTTATNLGGETDPAWARNLAANPEAEIVVAGQRIAIRATRATGSEAQRLWNRWIELQPAAERFRRIAGRPIPVFVLDPIGPKDTRRPGPASRPGTA